MSTKKSWLAAGMAVALLLTACGGNDDDAGSAGADDGNGGGADGDVQVAPELTIAYQAQPPTLDPVASTAHATRITARIIFEPLLAMDADLNPQPVLAESYEVSDDGLTYTFLLREGVTFHDGSEMTAEDVVASLERWQEMSTVGTSYFPDAEFGSDEAGVVTMTLPAPMYVADQLLADPAQMPHIMPAEVIENIGDEGLSEYIGTGPYQFGDWQTDQYIRLERYPDYVSPEGEPSALAGEKVAYYEEIDIQIVTDPSTRLSGLQTGEYDVTDAIAHDNYDTVDGDPNLEAILGNSGLAVGVFNKSEGLMVDEDMRRAVLAAVDPQAMLTAAYGNEDFFSDFSSLMPEDSPWYLAPDPEFDDMRSSPNPDLAADFLEDAGYDGETVRILGTRDYEDMYSLAVMLQQQLEAAGMNTDLMIQDWPTVTERREDPSEYEITLTSITNWPVIPATFLFFNSGWVGWTDSEEISDATAAMIAAADEGEALAAVEGLQDAAAGYLPVVNFGGRTSVMAGRSSEVTGLEYQTSLGEIFHHIQPVE